MKTFSMIRQTMPKRRLCFQCKHFQKYHNWVNGYKKYELSSCLDINDRFHVIMSIFKMSCNKHVLTKSFCVQSGCKTITQQFSNYFFCHRLKNCSESHTKYLMSMRLTMIARVRGIILRYLWEKYNLWHSIVWVQMA